MRHAFIKWLSIALAVSAPIATDRNGYAETPSIVSPPRTISDIAAILDQERPNPEQLTALRVAAAATPPQSASDREVARFYFRRAQARFALNRIPEAIADTENALARLTDKVSREAFTIQQFLAVLYRSDSLRALRLLREMEHAFSRRGTTAQRLSIYRHTVGHLTFLGDLQHAELYLRKSIALFGESVARGDTATELYRSSWEADLELTRAILLEARGQFMDAEAALAKSLTMRRDSLAKSAKWPTSPPKSGFQQVIDQTIQSLGRVKALDGRLVEAEAKMRRALLNRLKLVGKYHNTTAFAVRQLARAINAQGRYGEAEKLLRSAVEIYESVGVAETSQAFLRLKLELAETLTAQGRWNDALRIFGAIDKGLEAWPPARRVTFQLRLSRIHALYRTGGAETGLKLAEALVARERSRVGENHYDYAMALAAMAVGLGQSGRDAEALAAFRLAVPILTLASREGSDEAGPAASKRDHQVRLVVEPYMALLARTANNTDGAAAAVESLGLADAIRGRSVQTALAAASARMATKDSALAELIRQEQDLRKRIGARFTLLNDVLALPPAQRDETAVAELRGTITLLRAQHVAARHDIGQRFPDYADLIDPKPPSIAEIQRALRSDETVLSFYFGLDHSFVWAVPKTGAPTFFMIPANAGAIEAKIKMLRKALEPDVSTVEDIPQFDLALAHELYSPLLKPLEATWKPAKNLVVITNGALGLLPLGLLPTAPSEYDAEIKPLFAGYRKVPWLARTHAVTTVPSAAALRTLRQLPMGSAKRERFIAFGDPFFSAQQAVDAEKPEPVQEINTVILRGLPLRRRSAPQTQGVNSTELGLLPRLPDTADELKLMAQALRVDSSKVLNLGKAANEAIVKSVDLSRFRIVAFATHGLIPGDLAGLTQPALALSAPEVADVPGDGLLTMDEILALRLDADWVVLSACNTAAGAAADAEAASGLARAFFYAGTRAILMTNWSVHSASARELVTDIFRRQASDPSVARGEALRQAMMAMLDGAGFADDSGKPLFAYAHPLFWAPYSIIGDSAATQ